ncbi:MAG TPA: hypothetical protein VG939_07700 [Caulobacteraceae bacterium]|nr:hypothetical protein [Caulobacteraceae bacterium]
MTAEPYGAAPRPAPETRSPRALWSAIALALMAAMFLEAVLAGAMLSGQAWALGAHRMAAGLVIAAALGAGAASLVVLRRIPGGRTFAPTLLGLGAAAFSQAVLGVLTAKGQNLLWLHVPLGVALVGLAGQAVASARRLGGV